MKTSERDHFHPLETVLLPCRGPGIDQFVLSYMRSELAWPLAGSERDKTGVG